MQPKPVNVLIAYDGSEPSRRALERVTTLIPKAFVAVVTVASPVLGSVSAKVFHQAPYDLLVVK